MNKSGKRSSKKNESRPSNPEPVYTLRKTLAKRVEDSMKHAGKTLFHQRIIFVAKHLDQPLANVENTIKGISIKTFGRPENRITGLCIIYATHSVYMLEGSEGTVGRYMQLLVEVKHLIFKEAKIIVVYNNINQRYFKKLFYKNAEPQVLIEKIVELSDAVFTRQVDNVLKKVTTICKMLMNSPNDEPTLEAEYKKYLPELSLIDYVLNIDLLINIDHFGKIFQSIPKYYHYDEHVWPVPYDFIPNNVYDCGKYDINFTFGKKKVV